MKPKFRCDGDTFLIENYNHAAPFSSFFPALAGDTGKPMWVFYTNRGQGIASFGINNKDGAILEFLPANKAYQATPVLGFRTFIASGKSSNGVYEPFLPNQNFTQTFIIRPYELEIIERNTKLGIEVSVTTFGIPYEASPVLGRQVKIKNLSSKTQSFQIIDGLPRIVPFGMQDYHVKNMSRTIEAFAEVLNVKNNVPYFKLKVNPADTSELQRIHAGYFSFAVMKGDLQPVIVDPSVVFGHDTAFLSPNGVFSKNGTAFNRQLTSNIMPSSLFNMKLSLKAKEEKSWGSFYGYAEEVDKANAYAQKVQTTPNYIDKKREEMKGIYSELTKKMGLRTGNPVLDAYANITFMDNVLRGGYPVSLGADNAVVHLYSRKHGDMERDYNQFQVSATYFSQGNGNFRDVNQNRRHDLLLNPHVDASNIETFFNLIQLDGYNPLVLNPTKFTVARDAISHHDLKKSDQARIDFEKLRRQPVQVGRIYEFILRYAKDPLSVSNAFQDIIKKATVHTSTSHGEGYWVDHWTYNLDHLDQYFSIYPDRKKDILYEKENFTFHDSDHYVRTRREKYVITKDGKLRQYRAVKLHQEKGELIRGRKHDAHLVRTNHGKGEILKVTLAVKLLSLAAVKMSTLDPYGVGIEMEADKPGWCDALNGVPGLMGSSSHEMLELKRLVNLILTDVFPLSPLKNIEIPSEIAHFIKEVDSALTHYKAGSDFRSTWDRMSLAREHFREKTVLGVSGKARPFPVAELKIIFERFFHVLEQAEKKTMDPATKLPTSYFTYEVPSSALDHGWRNHLDRLPWKQHRIAPFLEGGVHMMKMLSPAKAKKLYETIKKSSLADKKLGMYKSNASLEKESPEIGRIRVFSGGWLENESIFLHMHYKFLLEVLRAGLIEEFIKEMERGLIPFRDAKAYGRSIFENSSFIASSEFPSRDFHGKGFVARLSGATSEFMSMIYTLVFGKRIFQEVEGTVVFAPTPSIPKDWFSKKDSFGLGKDCVTLGLFGVPVTFHNPSRKSGFGKKPATPTSYEWILEGRFHQHEGRYLTPEASLALREARLESLTVNLS